MAILGKMIIITTVAFFREERTQRLLLLNLSLCRGNGGGGEGTADIEYYISPRDSTSHCIILTIYSHCRYGLSGGTYQHTQ
jgi:hypothetical protein